MGFPNEICTICQAHTIGANRLSATLFIANTLLYTNENITLDHSKNTHLPSRIHALTIRPKPHAIKP